MTQINCKHIKECYKDGKCMWCGAVSTQDWKEDFRKKFPDRLSNIDARVYIDIIGHIESLLKEERRQNYSKGYEQGAKEERNAVLSEVERQVEKHYVPDFDNNTIHQKDLQDVLNNLRVK